MNKADKVYLDLLEDILTNGTQKGDRTGTGTISVFGKQIKFDMKEGFPLITTKKVFTKGIIHELLWFLNGDTNIKYLVDNGVNIWVPDAYKKYLKHQENEYIKEYNKLSNNGFFEIDLDWQNLTQEEFIDKIKTDDEFSKKWGELGPVYGSQWRKWGTNPLAYKGFNGDVPDWYDQIEEMMTLLKNDPNSRRIMINAWNPSDLGKMTLPPCHYGFQLYTRELSLEERKNIYFNSNYYHPHYDDDTISDNYSINDGDLFWEDLMNEKGINVPKRAISLMWNQRSVDTFLGLPFNIASYGILLHMIAKQVNMVPDELIGNLGDTHLYLNHIDAAREQLTRTPKDLPQIVLGDAVDLYSYKFEDIRIIGYDPHPTIKADISV